ncbi:MAG: hypothetical protein VXA26_08470, partial [Candidatus Neomarinimicrobiota bacterium]
NSYFPIDRSILHSIKAFVIDAGGSVVFSKNGTFNQKPDVVISIFGEEPYAEGFGDIPNVDFKANESGHFKALEKVSKDNIPVLSVFFSGRPLVVNKYQMHLLLHGCRVLRLMEFQKLYFKRMIR